MNLTFTPLARNRYRCIQFPKIVVKKDSLKVIRAAVTKRGRQKAIESALQQRKTTVTTSRKKHRSRYRSKT